MCTHRVRRAPSECVMPRMLVACGFRWWAADWLAHALHGSSVPPAGTCACMRPAEAHKKDVRISDARARVYRCVWGGEGSMQATGFSLLHAVSGADRATSHRAHQAAA